MKPLWKTVWWFLQKLKIQSLLVYAKRNENQTSQRHVYPVFTAPLFTITKVPVSTDGQVDKHNAKIIKKAFEQGFDRKGYPHAQQTCERCSTSLIIREMEVKTTGQRARHQPEWQK